MGGQDSPGSAADGAPEAYSTQLTYGSDGYHADGHTVVINPDSLNKAVAKFHAQLSGSNRDELTAQLRNSVVDPSSFGSIPGADVAYGAVRKYVEDHLDAMHQMGISLTDFVERVEAAAQLGTETDPVTRAQAARGQAMLRKMAF